MTLGKKSTATQELGALSDVIISAAGPHRRRRPKVLTPDAAAQKVDNGGLSTPEGDSRIEGDAAPIRTSQTESGLRFVWGMCDG